MRRGCRFSPVKVSVWRGHTVGFQPEYSLYHLILYKNYGGHYSMVQLDVNSNLLQFLKKHTKVVNNAYQSCI
jgi:hypothetical protein